MAANTSSPSQTESRLSKKKSKALERVSVVSSEPWLRPSLRERQSKDSEDLSSTWSSSPATKVDLKSMYSLSECLQLLQKLAEEVNNINQGPGHKLQQRKDGRHPRLVGSTRVQQLLQLVIRHTMKRGSKKAAPAGGSREPESLEISRRLILDWAAELDLNMVNMKTRRAGEKTDRRQSVKTDEDEVNDKLQRWAVELRDVKEANGVSDDELKKLLYPGGSNKSRMAAILPLLEFVTWSLLAEDTQQDAVSMTWLPAKQKAWRTGRGNPKYIPNSVWRWIQSAAVSFRLDVSTCHPWLAVSSDRLQLCEAAAHAPAPSQSEGLSWRWPCVLADSVLSAGRHYWEVEASRDGSWRVGVMSQSALRNKDSSVSPSRGFWTLWKASSLWACTNTPVHLEKATAPRRIGVYVDVGEGQVSFYDAERRVHIYTFSDSFKHGLIPVFGWLDGDTLLKVTPADLSVTAQGKHLQE